LSWKMKRLIQNGLDVTTRKYRIIELQMFTASFL